MAAGIERSGRPRGHDDDGRVTHAIRYDESMEHVLEELEGDAAEAAYGSRGSEIDSPRKPGAD